MVTPFDLGGFAAPWRRKTVECLVLGCRVPVGHANPTSKPEVSEMIPKVLCQVCNKMKDLDQISKHTFMTRVRKERFQVIICDQCAATSHGISTYDILPQELKDRVDQG